MTVCPVEAIYPDDELPEAWAHYAEWNDYLSRQWKALGYNIVQKREDLPLQADCAEQDKSEEDILTWDV